MLPEEGRDQHPLQGYKAVDVKLEGRPLIRVIVERLLDSGWFAPVHIAGPRSVYGEVAGDGVVIDTDGSFGENVRASVEWIQARSPNRPIAVTVCDVVPERSSLDRLMQSFHADQPCDIWFPMVHAPERREQLGASAWKPEYRVVPERGQPAVPILPGPTC